jgi:hypothetical protein
MRHLLRHNPPMTREERAALAALLAETVEEYRQELLSEDEDADESSGPTDFYGWDEDNLERRLGVPLLGYGQSRVAVLLPDDTVAKLPWGKHGRKGNRNEYLRWKSAEPRVRELLLPPLDYTSDGIIFFPRVYVLDEDRVEDVAAQARLQRAWTNLASASAEGTYARDLREENSGVYADPDTGTKRVVLIDYGD